MVTPGRGARPLAGPVVPLTASIGGGNELLGGGPTRPSGTDPLATRVLVRGEPVTAPIGRADNFAWPRSGVATIREGEPDDLAAPPAPPPPAAGQKPAPQQQQQQPPQAAPARPPAAATAPRPKAQQQQPQQQPADAKQPVQPRKAAPAPPRADNAPRPPLNIAR